MKLEPRRTEAFLRDPGATRVVLLLYGDDTGLIRERAAQLVQTVAGSADDPFRVVELARDAVGSIGAEMASLPMTGGRRVVVMRDVGDTAAPHVQAVLASKPPGLLVLEAPGLPTRAKLRTLVERADRGMAVACYPLEGRALEQAIRETLSGVGVTVDDDALGWLSGQLGADQAVTRSEVEKLALYAGNGGRVDATAARTCVGDLAGLSLDDALFSATVGDVAGADRALELAMAEGAAPVGVLRAALMHLQRLQRAQLAMASGASAMEATKAARPPVFYKLERAFAQALNIWSAAALEQACVRAWQAERACKRTGAPAETICRSAIVGLAQRSAASKSKGTALA